MTKNKKLRDIVLSVTLPIVTMLLRLLYHYYSFGNIIENIKNAPRSEALPILAQTVAIIFMLFVFIIENETAALLLCAAGTVLTVMLSPFLSLSLAPVITGFYVARFRAYEKKSKRDIVFLILTVFMCSLVCIVLFPAKAFTYDVPLNVIAEQFFYEISVVFTVAVVLITLGVTVLLLRTKNEKLVTACILFTETASIVFSLIFFNQVTDKEFFICSGYIVLFIYIIYVVRLKKD